MVEEKAHAEFSASGSERWLRCPGSIALSKKAPEQVDSVYALEGTKAHECLEEVLSEAMDLCSSVTLQGLLKFLRNKEPDSKYDDDIMHGHAVDAAAWIMQEFYKRGPLAELRCEGKVDTSPFTCPGQFGTLDAAIIEIFGRLTIIDYKYGAGIAVDPAGEDGRGNSQLVTYALAASYEFNHNFADVELVVIQPRAYVESGETIRRHIMTMDELLDWVPIMQKGVKAAKKKDAPLASGKWCRFCPAAVICPELMNESFRQAQIDFSDETGLESVPEPRMVKAKELGRMLEAAEKLETWIDALREHSFHLMQQGHKIPGFKLVEKRGTRKWMDPRKVFEKFGEEVYDKKLKSPAQIEKAFFQFRTEKKVVKDWIKKNTVVESSGLTMVKDSDKRLDHTTAAKDMFGPVIDV